MACLSINNVPAQLYFVLTPVSFPAAKDQPRVVAPVNRAPAPVIFLVYLTFNLGEAVR